MTETRGRYATKKPRKTRKSSEESNLETLFREQLIDAGLAGWVQEYVFSPRNYANESWSYIAVYCKDDPSWHVDFAFPEQKIIIELQGGTHERRFKMGDRTLWLCGGRHVRHEGYKDDRQKSNAAQLDGWRVFEFTTDMVQSNEAIRTVKEAL